ncbi:aldo/keto reductase [Herbiconiux ginsengi]|uniref:D-threo-aldose 1-dehydrogenase n=1 Tax=Herbiconiux ginsengi TaxID=381665 RepID=A0A1H3KNM4_9MICO|nr:aldo/keto reductase [Herbiconiux ginsengi]SDY53338.1 D-threo-aldose 1-dehydrogenase [Herbiconiux ginsengi]
MSAAASARVAPAAPGSVAAGLGALGYGVAALGNLYQAVPDAVWPGCVPAAWEAGIRYFDVAPHYGLGLAEERLGAALAGLPRDEFVVSTKVGRVLEPNPDYAGETDIQNLFDVPATRRRVLDYSRDGVLRSLEGSLERLGLDRIDLLLVHDPDDHVEEALAGAFPALDELKSQGVIGAYGAGMNQSAALTRFVRETDLDVVMLAGRYTLLDQSGAADLLPAALERGVAVIAAAVFNSGLLATDRPSASGRFDYGTVPAPVLARAERMADVASRHGVRLPELAAQFPLRHPAVSTVVLGAATPEQISANAALLGTPVPDVVWAELEGEGLLEAIL